MTEAQRGLALAVSVTLNVVLVAAVVGGLYFAQRTWKERAERAPGSLFETAKTLPKAEEDRLREQMRVAAEMARPQFRVAREHRKRAAQLAAAPTFDPTAVLDELGRANAAEMRARVALDDQLMTALADLSPEGRKKIAPVLERRSRGLRGRRGDRERNRDRDRRDEPPASEAAAAGAKS